MASLFATAAGGSPWSAIRRPEGTLVAILALATLMACAGLVWWGDTPLARWLMREAVATTWPRHVLFVFDWTLMCTAMMLPTALPVLAAMQRVVARQAHPGRLVLVCAVAFLAVWAVSGVAVLLAHQGLYKVWVDWPLASRHGNSIVGAAMALGGAYLWSPMAQRCVTACRTPMGFVARFWTGRPDVMGQALRTGAAYGLSCLGCCWPLMVAMSMLGLSDPVWMVAAAVFMALQKQHVAGLWLTRALGLLAILGGLALSQGWLPSNYVAPTWSSEYWANCQSR